MRYGVLADVVVLVHLGFLAFLVCGGFLAWRWPRLLWLHLPVVLWAVVVVAFNVPCPLTMAENRLRQLAGERGYSGSFIDHYLNQVIYPGHLLVPIRLLITIAVGCSYLGLLLRHRPRHSSVLAKNTRS